MDHSRRAPPRPQMPGNVCPVCSVSHFPFCPSHALSNQNPIFQSHVGHTFHRPFYDPPPDHLGPPSFNPGDRSGEPPPWHRNPSAEYRQYYGHSAAYGDDFASARYNDGNIGFKRMRVDEMGTGSFANESWINSSRISSEDERRLKLIRDHGIAFMGLPHGMDFNREVEGYAQESSGFGGGYCDGTVPGRLNEFRGGRNCMKANPSNNLGANDFRDTEFGNFERKGASCLENYGEEHGVSFGQGRISSYRDEEPGNAQYDRPEYSLGPSLQTNGCSNLVFEHPTNVEKGGAPYSGGINYSPNKGHSSRATSQKDGFDQHSFVSQSHNEALAGKKFQYSGPSNQQGLQGISAPYHEESNFTNNLSPNNQLPWLRALQHPKEHMHVFYSPGHLSDMRQASNDGGWDSIGHQNVATPGHYGQTILFNRRDRHVPIPAGNSIVENKGQTFGLQPPPLPSSPPPPPPLPHDPLSDRHVLSSPTKMPSPLFPIPDSSSTAMPRSYAPIFEAQSLANPYLHDKSYHVATGFPTEELHTITRTQSNKLLGDSLQIPLDEPKVVDASHIFKQPQRAMRPNHFVIILRGLPGSGKSYLAKFLRDLEVENGGAAPRIHSMDDYFMTEVEKVDESEVAKSSGSSRGKKPTMKVMEYCYEPEMEEAYRSSMLKAFKKTLEEGGFSFVIVDDRNLRVADFAQFWATAKRFSYEVYLLEAIYKDPVGCAARNIHGFTQEDVKKMAGQWEEAPPLYMKLDIKSLLHRDDLNNSEIAEVDMDTEDGDSDGPPSDSEERNPKKMELTTLEDKGTSMDGSSNHGRKLEAGEGQQAEVKELGKSKWSDDLDEVDTQQTQAIKGKFGTLSGLMKAYTKGSKSVHWGDQVGNTGFSIGAMKRANISLVIGPGAGYNLKSNPLAEEDHIATPNSGESKRHRVFQEQIRAERESFKAVFDKRRQRIGGLDLEEE